jgi:hypothetical protein
MGPSPKLKVVQAANRIRISNARRRNLGAGSVRLYTLRHIDQAVAVVRAHTSHVDVAGRALLSDAGYRWQARR